MTSLSPAPNSGGSWSYFGITDGAFSRFGHYVVVWGGGEERVRALMPLWRLHTQSSTRHMGSLALILFICFVCRHLSREGDKRMKGFELKPRTELRRVPVCHCLPCPGGGCGRSPSAAWRDENTNYLLVTCQSTYSMHGICSKGKGNTNLL